jgi:hypothetical protein
MLLAAAGRVVAPHLGRFPPNQRADTKAAPPTFDSSVMAALGVAVSLFAAPAQRRPVQPSRGGVVYRPQDAIVTLTGWQRRF